MSINKINSSFYRLINLNSNLTISHLNDEEENPLLEISTEVNIFI